MNIKLKPIAESKVRQLGGDVCGVLVRTEDSEVMAVSEHGRCTRLDAGVMGPVDGAQRGQGAEMAPIWLSEPQETEQLIDGRKRKLWWECREGVGTAYYPGTASTENQDAESFCDSHCTWLDHHPDCTVPVGYMGFSPDGHKNKFRTSRFANSIPVYAHPPTQPQPAVPEGLSEAIKAIAEKLEKVEGESADGGYMWDARECAEFIREEADKLSTPTTPQADGWIRCEDRLPTEADADCFNQVWLTDVSGDGFQMEPWQVDWSFVTKGSGHWMPTGLKRPQPPAGQEESGDEH